jgi:Ca2+-binding RTX toxin-like protein
MRLPILLLTLAALAAFPAAASADYTLDDDADEVIVGPGAETSITVEYNTICGGACPGTQTVESTSGVPIANSSGNCAIVDTSLFQCTKRPFTRVTGTNNADRVGGTCGGSANSGLRFNGLAGDDSVFAITCLGGNVVLGEGNDTSYAGGRVGGNAGRDTLVGSIGVDSLDGGPGRDLLHGGAGPDRFEARDGRRDTIMCGFGRDKVRADARDRLIDCGRP